MKKNISIIGGGSSALILGCELDVNKYDVIIYEKNSKLGRKFLVAGEGGLNLTHSESQINFINKYTPSSFIFNAFKKFSNTFFIEWLNESGIEIFIGSSGRVFPKKGIKPIQVLNAIINKIKKKGVVIKTNYEWKGFTHNNELIFEHNLKKIVIKSDYVIYSLGGASWPVTGSKGNWMGYFEQKKVNVIPFQPSNCAYKINWHQKSTALIEGYPLKNCSFSCGNKKQLGEAVLTNLGIEGNAIYPLSNEIRKQLNEFNTAVVNVDFKPGISRELLIKKLKKFSKKQSYTQNIITNLNINQLQIRIIKMLTSKDDFLNPLILIDKIKCLEIEIVSTDKIENAISTVGGIDLKEIDLNFELKKIKNHYAIGEMLDFDAPTGGYLLQSCFSMSNYLAHYLKNK